MLKYLEDSESTKVGTRELEEQVLFPYESEKQYCANCETSKK